MGGRRKKGMFVVMKGTSLELIFTPGLMPHATLYDAGA